MTESKETVTRLRYDVERIIAQKNSIGLDLYHKFAQQKLAGVVFQQFVRFVFSQVSLALQMSLLQFDVIQESLRPYAGTTLTQTSAVDLMHRLLGNKWTLKENKPVRPYARVEGKEWVPIQIMRADTCSHSKKGDGFNMTFKVLAGFPTLETTTAWWSRAYCRFVAWKMFGMVKTQQPGTRKQETFRYKHGMDLVTLRLSALIDYDKSEKLLVFLELISTQGLMRWNKEQMRYRARKTDAYKCPQNYPLTVACHTCPIGYLQCRAGCHPATYAVKLCPSCATEAYFDEGLAQDLCINCYAARNANS